MSFIPFIAGTMFGVLIGVAVVAMCATARCGDCGEKRSGGTGED